MYCVTLPTKPPRRGPPPLPLSEESAEIPCARAHDVEAAGLLVTRLAPGDRGLTDAPGPIAYPGRYTRTQAPRCFAVRWAANVVTAVDIDESSSPTSELAVVGIARFLTLLMRHPDELATWKTVLRADDTFVVHAAWLMALVERHWDES